MSQSVGAVGRRVVRRRIAAALAAVSAVMLVLAVAACTTEFATEGGNCQVDGDCETGEVCRTIVGPATDEPVGVCFRACRADSDCVAARGEICRLEADGESGTCGRVCVVDSDCPDHQQCAFDRCVDRAVLADQGAPAPDAAPADAAADMSTADGALADAALDASGADMALESPDMAADAGMMADGAPADQGAAPDAAAGDAAPAEAVDMAPDAAAP